MRISTKPKSTSTLKITTATKEANNVMLSAAVGALQGLSPHLRIRDQRKNLDSKKRNRRDELIVQKRAEPVKYLSNVTGIEGKNKLTLEQDYHHSISNTNKTALLGSLSNAQKPQENLNRIVSDIKTGSQIDFTA